MTNTSKCNGYSQEYRFSGADGNMPPAGVNTFLWTVLGFYLCFTQLILAAADDTPPKVKVIKSLELYFFR